MMKYEREVRATAPTLTDPYADGFTTGRMYGSIWAVNPSVKFTVYGANSHNFRVWALRAKTARLTESDRRKVRAWLLGAARGCRSRG